MSDPYAKDRERLLNDLLPRLREFRREQREAGTPLPEELRLEIGALTNTGRAVEELCLFVAVDILSAEVERLKGEPR